MIQIQVRLPKRKVEIARELVVSAVHELWLDWLLMDKHVVEYRRSSGWTGDLRGFQCQVDCTVEQAGRIIDAINEAASLTDHPSTLNDLIDRVQMAIRRAERETRKGLEA